MFVFCCITLTLALYHHKVNSAQSYCVKIILNIVTSATTRDPNRYKGHGVVKPSQDVLFLLRSKESLGSLAKEQTRIMMVKRLDSGSGPE
jgi:hypothetical protein